jgi:hypothetical protein
MSHKTRRDRVSPEERFPPEGIIAAPKVESNPVCMDIHAIKRKRAEVQDEKLFHLFF